MARHGTLGIDVGGTKVMAALFNDVFHVVDEIKFKTQPDKGERAFTRNLSDAVERLVEKADKKGLHLIGVGVGCGGTVDNEKGILKECLNVPFLEGYRFRSRLSRMTGAGVTLANDVHAGLYGEQQLGAAVGRKNVIGIFIGTGIGGALILNGRLYLGSRGHAGNIGSYLMNPVGALTGSRREGVLDDIASRMAIAAEAASLAAKQWAPHLLKGAGTDVREIRSDDLATAIEKGDKSIEKLVRSRARIVGVALSNLVDLLNPDMVVLGGGLVKAMPAIIRQEVKAGIDQNTTRQAREKLEVVVSKLKDHAVTTGAAKLAMDEFAARQTAPEPAHA
jgi:glucokinase